MVFLHAEVARQRRERRRRLEGEVEAMREEARDFRLITTALSSENRVRSRAEEQEKLSQGSIETIHQQLYYNLALLRSALQLQTCALLWLDEIGRAAQGEGAGQRLAPHRGGGHRRGRRRAGRHLEGAAPLRAGGAAPRRCSPTTAARRRSARSSACPVVEGRDAARDPGRRSRRRARSSTTRPSTLMASAAEQVVRVVQSERVFQAVERSKHEHERFYRASAELNRALTLDEVYAAAIAGARGVCEFDFAAVATFDARRGSHTIRCVVGEAAEHLLGTTHKDPSSIASMVAKNKLALPAGGEWRERDVPVFSHPMRIKDYESLLVLPLLVKDEVIGTFTVAAAAAGRLPHRQARDAGGDRQPGRHLAGQRAACTRCSRSRPPPTGSPAWSTTARSRSGSRTCWAAPSATASPCRCC